MDDQAAVEPPFRVTPVRAAHELEAVRDLFAAYATALPVTLDYQDFGSELAGLPGKYASPAGELLLALDSSGRHIGCIAMRRLDAGRCEMKRLYVIPQARSLGLGKVLTKAIISVARERGYSELLLDTLPTMATAASLYEQMGFKRIEAYYAPTPAGTIFMKLDLAVLEQIE